MCNHKAVSRWHRFWGRWALTALISFLVPEIYGLTTVGPEATFSAWCWHRLGVLVPCRHTRLGRVGISATCVWLWAHLSYGKFGVAPRRRHQN